jgi:Ca-activated chloride channel family protein
MKTILSALSLSFLFAVSAFGQYEYSLTVKTNKGRPDMNRDVVFIETTTYEHLPLKTDSQGKLTYTFTHGNWLGSIGEMRNCIRIDATRGGKGTNMFTYDPVGYALQNKSVPDRRTIDFKIVSQERMSPLTDPTSKESVLTIVLKDQKNKTYAGKEIALCDFERGIIYQSRSNSRGAASFLIPVDSEYDVDIDGVESIRRIAVSRIPMNTTLTVLYQPRTFTEKKDDKFIVQTTSPDIKPSSSHVRVKMKVQGGPNGGVQEDVYVRMLKSNTVFKAKTNDNAEAIFMLPVKQKYFVDFTYQRDADQIDLSHIRGIAFKNINVLYKPDPRLQNIESFIPKVKDLVEYDMDNFVEKQYPEPEAGNMDFYLNWGNKFNENSKEALLEIGLKVKSKMARKNPVPLNVCFVVDKSGSMMGEERIEELKRSMIDFVSHLEKDDIVSVVVFDSQATVAVPAEKVGDKKKVIDIIHAIGASGGTVIYDGLTKGFAEVKKNSGKGFVDRLILLTDGYGSRPPLEVIDMAKSNIKSGIELSAVGVGTGYNQELLFQLASAGGGLMHLAGTGGNIRSAFTKELQSILYPMAEDAVLEVRYNDQIVYRQLFGYSQEVVTKGKMTCEIPHLFPGLNKMALIKFDLINPTKEIIKEKVVVSLIYTDPETKKEVRMEKKIHPEWTDATGELDMTLDKEHKKVLAVAIANQQLKVMAESYEAGDKQKAEAVVRSARDQINQLFPKAKSEEVLAMLQRLTEYVEAFETLKSLKLY